MGQGAAKAKSGGEKDAQTTDKDNNKASTARDELIKFMRDRYKDKVQPAKSFDEFYHAIYELIEMFCESRGQLQYRIPSRDQLYDQYQNVQRKKRWGADQSISKEEFETIAKGLLKVDSFTFGKAAVHMLVVLFGLPVCAVVTKRFIPGLKSVSDDIFIPAATSGAVVYLAKTNKL